MNLLPHKSWNVWKRDNIAKVERDEAAHKLQLEEQRKQQIAEQRKERFQLLQERTRAPNVTLPTESPDESCDQPTTIKESVPLETSSHFNFFEDYERQYRKAEKIVQVLSLVLNQDIIKFSQPRFNRQKEKLKKTMQKCRPGYPWLMLKILAHLGTEKFLQKLKPQQKQFRGMKNEKRFVRKKISS
jgi:hypothetical protein